MIVRARLNFNHERWSIAVQALRSSRVCIEESVDYARRRKTFGVPLAEHQVIRESPAEPGTNAAATAALRPP